MWSKDSMQHHIFILQFADCRNKRLGYNLVEEIRKSQESFEELNEEVNDVLAEYEKNTSPNYYQRLIKDIKHLLQKYIKYDKRFLAILKDLQEIGQRDDIWQTLIDHIIDEQKYSFRLMKNFKAQLDNIS